MITHYNILKTMELDSNGLVTVYVRSVIDFTPGTGKKTIFDVGITKVDNGFRRVRTEHSNDLLLNRTTITTIDREIDDY